MLIRPITNKIGVLADRAGVEVEELVEILMGPLGESTEHHPWHRAERGEIGVDDLQTRVAPYADARGVELHGDEIAFLFEIDFTVIRPVIDRLEALRADGYRTGLLTNSFQSFRATLEELVDMSRFDAVVDSSEVGYRKPERAIYDLTAERLGVEPSRIIFLDDFGPNVDRGAGRGLDRHPRHRSDRGAGRARPGAGRLTRAVLRPGRPSVLSGRGSRRRRPARGRS